LAFAARQPYKVAALADAIDGDAGNSEGLLSIAVIRLKVGQAAALRGVATVQSGILA